MTDDLLKTDYINFLIKQYWEKPKAKAEITLLAEEWDNIANLIKEYPVAFDLDQATGDQLDKIGKIVGAPRVVSFVTPKIRFGFSDNPNARGFADYFDSTRPSAPFKDANESVYTDYQLGDEEYRFFIKVKVAANNTSGYIVNDDYTSINMVVFEAFDGLAYVVDNQDMTLTLYISPTIEIERVNIVTQLGLWPHPQAVGYKVTQANPEASFGFSDNPYSKGFADSFDSSYEGGIFASSL